MMIEEQCDGCWNMFPADQLFELGAMLLCAKCYNTFILSQKYTENNR
jgi:hypothetical protein